MQVVIPLSLQRRVEGLLQEHIDRTQLSSGKADNILDGTKSSDIVTNTNMDENPDSFLDGSVMEKVLQRRSLRMRNMQRGWQVSFRVSIFIVFSIYSVENITRFRCLSHSMFPTLILKIKDVRSP